MRLRKSLSIVKKLPNQFIRKDIPEQYKFAICPYCGQLMEGHKANPNNKFIFFICLDCREINRIINNERVFQWCYIVDENRWEYGKIHGKITVDNCWVKNPKVHPRFKVKFIFR